MRRTPLLILLASIFVDMAGYAMVAPLLPFYVARVGGGATAVGLLGALYAAVQLVSVPAIGALSDRWGRRPLLALCLLGTALGNGLLALAHTPALLIAALAVDSTTGGTLSLAQAYVADHTAPEERARGMGLLGAAFGLGLILGPALGAGLGLVSLAAPALAAAALALVNALAVLAALKERRTHSVERTTSSALALRSTLYALRLAGVRRLLLTVFLLNLAFAGLQSNFPLFSRARFGWGPSANAIFYAFVGVCAVLTQGVALPRAQPRAGERRLAAAGLASFAAGLALVALAPAAWLLYPAVGLAALGSGLAIPSLTALLSARTPPERQGALMGATAALLSVTQIIGPAVAGISFDRIGLAAPYLIGSALAACALGVFARDGAALWNAASESTKDTKASSE